MNDGKIKLWFNYLNAIQYICLDLNLSPKSIALKMISDGIKQFNKISIEFLFFFGGVKTLKTSIAILFLVF